MCRSWCLQTTWSRCGWLILSPCWRSSSGLPYVTLLLKKRVALGFGGLRTNTQQWTPKGRHELAHVWGQKTLPFIQPLRAGGVNKQHNGTCMEAHSTSETDGHALPSIFPPIVSPFVSNWDCYEPLNYEVLWASAKPTLFISKATTKVRWSLLYLMLHHHCSDRKGSCLSLGHIIRVCDVLHYMIPYWSVARLHDVCFTLSAGCFRYFGHSDYASFPVNISIKGTTEAYL